MDNTIYISEKTGQIVPKEYPNAVMYVRADYDGIIMNGKMFALTKDADHNFDCANCEMNKICLRPNSSGCMSAQIFGTGKANCHFEINE